MGISMKLTVQEGLQRAGSCIIEYEKCSYAVYISDNDIEEFINNTAERGAVYIFSKKLCQNEQTFVAQAMEACRELGDNVFLLHTDRVPASLIDLADELGVPIYACHTSVSTRELLRMADGLLRDSEKTAHRMEKLFQSLINRTYDSQGRMVFEAQQLGINLEIRSMVLILYNRFPLTAEQMESFYAIAKENMQRILKRNLLMGSNGEEVIAVIPYETSDIEMLLREIETAAAAGGLELSLSAGVGMPGIQVDQLSDSYFQARRACKLQAVLESREKVQYFSKLGLYHLLFFVQDKKELQRFYKNMLGSLEEYDRVNDTNLTENLYVYLQNNCNSYATAAALFIHRNTLRYRLERINSIIQQDLDDRLVDAEFIVAFMIKKYLSSIEHMDTSPYEQ